MKWNKQGKILHQKENQNEKNIKGNLEFHENKIKEEIFKNVKKEATDKEELEQKGSTTTKKKTTQVKSK